MGGSFFSHAGTRAVGVSLASLGLLGVLGVTSAGLRAPAEVERLTPRAAATNTTTPFKVASFNVLGAAHTAKSKRYASGRTRAGYMVQIIKNADIDVVGFQELQPPQFEVFTKEMGSSWAVYPGDLYPAAAMHNSIAWRTDTWELVEENVTRIPYTRGLNVRMPFVLLRNLETGRLTYFANFHNASNPRGAGDQQKYRDQAVAKEIALANELVSSGVPVIFTGDFNERAPMFCKMTAGAPLESASGGSTGTPCTPPKTMVADWIFGSTNVTFTNFRMKRGPLVRKTTNHNVLVAKVGLPADPLR